jgi:hypothetical protein
VLERVGWGKRLDLDTLVYQERWGNLATAVAERNM